MRLCSGPFIIGHRISAKQNKQIHPSIDLHNNRTFRNDRRLRVDI